MAESKVFKNNGDIYFINNRSKNIFCKYWNNDYKLDTPKLVLI